MAFIIIGLHNALNTSCYTKVKDGNTCATLAWYNSKKYNFTSSGKTACTHSIHSCQRDILNITPVLVISRNWGQSQYKHDLKYRWNCTMLLSQKYDTSNRRCGSECCFPGNCFFNG